MLRIGFIFPSSEYLFDPFRGDPHTHFQILTMLEHYFGSAVSVSLIDLRGIKKEFAIRHIPECDIYLHSVYTLDYDEQISVVQNLRRNYPKAIHIAGGPHASVYREETLASFEALVLGDGERSLIRAIEDFQNNRLQRIYRMEAPTNLNEYPFPRRHYLPKAAIARRNMMNMRHQRGPETWWGTTAIFSRGCPGQCYFCAMPQVRADSTPILRYRAPHLVEEEIEYLKREYGIQGLNLLDEIAIPPNPRQAVSHLEALGRTGIKWRGQIRVDGLSPEIAKLAGEAGGMAMGLGVESVSQLSLDIINKGIDLSQAHRTIALLKENGIEPRLYIIIGLPGEPPDIVEKTWTFITETDPDLVILSLFTIRPGTELFNNPSKFGIKSIREDWRKTMHMYGRYDDELPSLTFEYERDTPWGRSFTNREIVENYQELQRRLREAGLNALPYYKEEDMVA